MDVSGKLLDIIFRRIPPERMYNKLNKDALGLSAKHNPKKAFLRFAESSLSGYSQDEQTQFYLYLEGETQKMANMLGTQPSVFLPFVWFGNHVLNAMDEEPTCKLEKVLEWREVYHILGQDQCFRACFSNQFDSFECDLLYFYLQLKTAFRAEMIQVNGQAGFQNFSNYQDRKSLIWENQDGYWYEAYRMALNAPIQKENVISFESRLCPCNDSNRLRKKVEAYDHAKWFADQTDQPLSFEVKNQFSEVQMSGKLLSEPHFYVLHYPKQKDDDPRETSKFIPKCRHENLRRNVKVSTLAIEEALSQSDYLCSRVRGIDACSNEIVCRPEVFATAYRFLDKMQSTVKTYSHSLLGAPEYKLSMTYHAGEDFYDIVDTSSF